MPTVNFGLFMSQPLLSGIFKLLVGSAAAQAVQTVLFPFCAAAYGPEAVAYYGLVLAVIGMTAPFVNLRGENIVLVERIGRQERLSKFFSLITILLSLVCIPLLWVFFKVAGGGHLAEADYIVLFASIVLGNWSQFATVFLVKRKMYVEFGKLNFYRVLFFFVIAFFLSFLGPSFSRNGLIVAVLFSSLALGVMTYRNLNVDVGLSVRRKELRWLRALFFKYKTTLTVGVAQGVLNGISHNIPIVLFSAYFSPLLVGGFVVLDRLLRAPVSLLNNHVRNVVTGLDGTGLDKRLVYIQAVLLVGGGGAVLIMWVLSSYFSKWLEGSGWSVAPSVFLTTVCWAAFYANNSIGSAFITKYQDYAALFWAQVTDTVFRVCAIVWAAKTGAGFELAVMGYVVVSCAFNCFVACRGWQIYIKRSTSD